MMKTQISLVIFSFIFIQKKKNILLITTKGAFSVSAKGESLGGGG